MAWEVGELDIKKKGGVAEGVDPLVDGVVRVREFFSKNGTVVMACCAAIVIFLGVALIYNNMRESSIRKAQEIFGVGILDYNADRFDEALASFGEAANTYRNTPIGAMSAFMMGSVYLQQGNVDQAVTWFEAAVNIGGAGGFVKGQALEGLAAAYEEKGNAAAAVRSLERALHDKNVAHRHPAIRWKLALLNKDNPSAAGAYCKALIADTLAGSYHQKAENLLAALNAAGP
jgi:hypothetical protein